MNLSLCVCYTHTYAPAIIPRYIFTLTYECKHSWSFSLCRLVNRCVSVWLKKYYFIYCCQKICLHFSLSLLSICLEFEIFICFSFRQTKQIKEKKTIRKSVLFSEVDKRAFKMHKLVDKCPKLHPVVPGSCIIVAILFMFYHHNDLIKFFAGNSTDIVQSSESDGTVAIGLSDIMVKKETNKVRGSSSQYVVHHRKHQRNSSRRKASTKNEQYKKLVD